MFVDDSLKAFDGVMFISTSEEGMFSQSAAAGNATLAYAIASCAARWHRNADRLGKKAWHL